MILNIRTQLDYQLHGPSSVLLQLEAALLADQNILEANIDVQAAKHFARVSGEDGIGDRIWVQADGRLRCTYVASVEVARAVTDISQLNQVPPHLLPGDTVKYLMASRFCPADEFQNFTAAEFGHLAGGARVTAMRDWIESNFQYTSGASNAQTTALDTFVQRQGICRDFAHVMITLARASAIPARMTSVYALGVTPPDFHAVAEVFLDGAWYPVDATGMTAADRIARIGVGRDAADIAFMTIYGKAELKEQSVSVAQG